MFGRSLDVLQTIPVTKKEEYGIVSKHIVKNIVPVCEEFSLFLTHANVDYNLIRQANQECDIKLLTTPMQMVKSNVAIASAITAYARIRMMDFKTIPGVTVFYTDTDSVFMDKELPTEMVGDELGQMKDELNGG